MSDSKTLISVPSALISPRAAAALSPAMTAVLWEIAAILDERRVPELVENSVWLEVPATRLRGPGSQGNNRWLRVCLERLNGLQIGGEYRGAAWGAVLLSEWHLEKGEGTARLLITPAAVQALRAPATFARIETEAAHRLPGPGRRLYAALADKKRLDRTWWRYGLDELRALFGVEGRYPRWGHLRSRILQPALKSINDFGTVHVTMIPEKADRKVVAVRFDWRWKSLDEARVTAEETGKSVPYAEQPAVPTAPPLAPGTRADRERNEEKWWNEQPAVFREDCVLNAAAQAGRNAEHAKTEAALAVGNDQKLLTLVAENAAAAAADPDRVRAGARRAAWEEAHPDEPAWDELPD